MKILSITMQTIKQHRIQYNEEQYKLYNKIQYILWHNKTWCNMMQHDATQWIW